MYDDRMDSNHTTQTRPTVDPWHPADVIGLLDQLAEGLRADHLRYTRQQITHATAGETIPAVVAAGMAVASLAASIKADEVRDLIAGAVASMLDLQAGADDSDPTPPFGIPRPIIPAAYLRPMEAVR